MARILIVDDSITYRQLLKKILEDGGHTIVGEAGDGMIGIEMFKKLQPDIVTMDITMPNMSGLAALKWILEYDPSAIVIMVSASAQSAKINEATELGAFDFLPKPFESKKVLDVVDNLLNAVQNADNFDDELDLEDFEFLEEFRS